MKVATHITKVRRTPDVKNMILAAEKKQDPIEYCNHAVFERNMRKIKVVDKTKALKRVEELW